MFPMDDDFQNEASDLSAATPLELSELKYNKLLDGFLNTVDKYAELSLKVRSGEITADEAIRIYDDFLAPKAMLLMMLDKLRGDHGLFARAERQKAEEIENEIARFREQLDNGL